MTDSPRRVAGTVRVMAWELEAFEQSLNSVAPANREAYARDLGSFVEWADRAGLDGPGAVERTTLRRYLAYSSTRRYAPRTIARRASALRRYFAWLVRTGRLTVDPAAGLHAPKGESRLPRVLRGDELKVLLDEPPAVGRR